MTATLKSATTALPPAPTQDGLPVRVGLLDLHAWLEAHGLTIVGRADQPGGHFVVLLAPCRPQEPEATP